jgi:hypothetical protein
LTVFESRFGLSLAGVCSLEDAGQEPVKLTSIPLVAIFNGTEVLDDMLHYVRIVGEAKEDPDTGKVVSIKIKVLNV